MDLVRRAFEQLYPQADSSQYTFYLRYSRAFNAYNANVRYKRWDKEYTFSLSYPWRDVDEDIQMGMLQHLMLKCFTLQPSNENNLDLYESFMRHVHKGVEKTEADSDLMESFERMNELFFHGTLDRPNLRWGNENFRQLGLYEYGSDTITISSVFREGPQRLLDYVMYHEMLHKKHKFTTSAKGRSMHHSKAFRDDERKYDGFSTIEGELNAFLRRKKRRFSWF